MTIPQDRKYAKSHEWAREEDGVVFVGITDFAQKEMGDLVFVELPEEGDEVQAGETFGNLESVKAVSEILSPATGVVLEINEEALDNPSALNESAHETWLIKISDATLAEDLLDAAEYAAHCEG